ncbi:hypothetical protein G6O69_04510 [Pseudenhygromyxa sp. WMMC2535]|uniref:hypothetical protein n=1 Tax=Pseudenhygromyxa sp. WMMC2535 TaxID=2712867 RepID=UPI00159573F0|nr:hypothetical protein [Pseudenhygromyxa sp. WMMC2535]NVB37080.1 hypothetical protein [Pseudenhygromyxa sp. WMMC2535]
MVPAAPPAAEGQAAEDRWLSELRRWLHLGRRGVIILVRDARRARLRALVETLEAVDPSLELVTDPGVLTELEPGALVLLVLRRATLDWLNLNRPLFAARSLRVVLWAEGELGTELKFLAPDLHDWVSHFVTCPPGVPDFAVEGLAQGLGWWPGVAWTGEGLELALGRLEAEREWVGPLSPSEDYARLVEVLTGAGERGVVWRSVDTMTALWRLRWAIAEARHRGPHVLDNPEIRAPGWYRVDAGQLSIDEVLALPGVDLRAAVAVELEPGVLAEGDGEVEEDARIEEVGLLRAVGPVMRGLHDSEEVARWRRKRIAEIRERAGSRSRDEQALFASLERDRAQWPRLWGSSWALFDCEYLLRRGEGNLDIDDMVSIAEGLGLRDVAARWCETRGGERPMAIPHPVKDISEIDKEMPVTISGRVDGAGIESSERSIMVTGEVVGWEMSRSWRLALIHALGVGVNAPEQLLPFAVEVLDSARAQLGEADPHYLFIGRILGLVAGAFGELDWAYAVLLDVAEVALREDYPLLRGADLECSVVVAMRGSFEQALDMVARSPVENEDARRAFEDFHRLTRAALGEPTAATPEGPLAAGEPLFDALQREGRMLLRMRAEGIGNLAARIAQG